MKSLIPSFASVVYLLLGISRAAADVIYLTNGSVLVVKKAWEEDGEVRYEAGSKVQALSKTSVRRIQEQKAFPAPEGASSRYGIGSEDRSSAGDDPVPPRTPALRSGTSVVSKEMLTHLRENLKSSPGDANARSQLIQALNSIASLQVAQGDLSAARNSLDEALARDQKDLATLSNLAVVNYRIGNYRATEDLLLAYLRIDNGDQNVRLLLGEAYYAQDKISQAINEWTQGLQFGPNAEIEGKLRKARSESGVHSELGVLQSAHFILRYDRKVSDYQLGQQILTTLEGLYRQLSIDLVSQAPATVAVILYPDQAYFDITRAPSWSGALFDGKIRVPTQGLSLITPELSATLAHELTHAFIRSLPGRGCPAWFNEGVAQFQEGKSASKYHKWLEGLTKGRQIMPLSALKGSLAGLPADTASLAYIEGLAAVEFLAATEGKASIRRILDLVGQNYNFENAFQNVVRKSVDQFDVDWRESLRH